MPRLAAHAHGGVLGLDEIADLGAVSQHRARPQPRKRADARRAFGHHAFQVTVGTHFGAQGQAHVTQPAERADPHAIAELHIALEHHVHVDFHVAADGDLAADIHPCRIGHACALPAQLTHLAQLERALELRQLP